MVKNKFNRAIHNEPPVYIWENRLTMITHFLCKKGISINNNNKHKAINTDIIQILPKNTITKIEEVRKVYLKKCVVKSLFTSIAL